MSSVLFVYARSGRVKCVPFVGSPNYLPSFHRKIERELLADGWKHTATLDPAAWIEHLMNDGLDPSDVMDELNFGPQCTKSPSV